MEFKIYQLINSRETDYGFMGWNIAKKHGFKISDYQEVYSGEREKKGILDNLFKEFNLYHPADFRGHSLSVSDVVALKEPENDYWYWSYCDSWGWEEITDTINGDQPKEMTKKMTKERALYLAGRALASLIYETDADPKEMEAWVRNEFEITDEEWDELF